MPRDPDLASERYRLVRLLHKAIVATKKLKKAFWAATPGSPEERVSHAKYCAAWKIECEIRGQLEVANGRSGDPWERSARTRRS